MSIKQIEKEDNKVRLSLTLEHFLNENNKRNKQIENKGDYFPTTLRGLETASDLTYSQIQATSLAIRDLAFTSVINMIIGLSVNPSEFFQFFENISEDKVLEKKKKLEQRRKK